MNKYYIILYEEGYGIISGIRDTLKNYSISYLSKYDEIISQIYYQDKIYSIKNYITKKQRIELQKIRIENLQDYKPESLNAYDSIIDHQYIEIILENGTYESSQFYTGFPQIIWDSIIKTLRKPIYYFNLLDENEMILLKKNFQNQFINRLEMAQFIETKPIKIHSSLIKIKDSIIDCFKVIDCSLKKPDEIDARIAWFSIGEAIYLDQWAMTALFFTPIDFEQFKSDLEVMNFNKEINEIMMVDINSQSIILRLEYYINNEGCSYLIENRNNFKYKSVARNY